MRIVRKIGIIGGVLVGLLAIAIGVVYVASSARLRQTYQVPEERIEIPADQASIERGRHLATTIGQCVDCHGDNLAGRVFLDSPGIARLSSANLTSGKGGVGGTFTDADWVRALRHGVGPNGKPLVTMPSQNFTALSGEDLGALIAYVKSVPPVDHVPEPIDVQIIGRALFLAGQIKALSAEEIDHNAAAPALPAMGATAEYGRYLVRVGGCADCHGPSLAGGPMLGAPPDLPPAANITPGGEISAWSEADFIKTMRTGMNPAGLRLNPFMPWKYIGRLSDDELKAIYLYLKTVPAQASTTR
jgi:mono/diheme cytochrome c family protein